MDPIEWVEAKKNLNRQGTKVLHDIVNAYQTGLLDDPKTAMTFCSLLACICEGKVEGAFDEHSGNIKWSLTKEYSVQVDALREAMMKVGLDSGKVIKGPWG